jgi:hypothetical protein
MSTADLPTQPDQVQTALLTELKIKMTGHAARITAAHLVSVCKPHTNDFLARYVCALINLGHLQLRYDRGALIITARYLALEHDPLGPLKPPSAAGDLDQTLNHLDEQD